MRVLLSRVTVLLSALFVLALSSFAQFSQRGSISGVVTEASGAVVSAASVTLLDLGRNQTSTSSTDASGQYQFSDLLPGHYQVSVELSGFKKVVSEPIKVSAQSSIQYDLQLQVGTVSEQVEVTAAAPLLQTESADFDQNITENQIASVPMNGRNWTSLTALTPGVSTSPRVNINLGGTFEVGASYTSGGVDYTAGGNAEGSRDNGYYINGVNANENYLGGSSFQPSAEAIGEVKVGVADFSAQYGRDFTNLSASTKSGSNVFHGEFYDFFENDALNALVPINKAEGLFTKSAYRFNLYGGNFGGPIYIPKVLNLKDRAFFFVSYERNPHSLAGPNNLAIVPSDAQRAGNFGENCTGPINAGVFDPVSGLCSNPAGQLYNPNNGTAVPFNNLVAAGLYDPGNVNPTIAGIANLFPQANLTPTLENSGANYQYSAKQAVDPYHWDSRFDYRISSKDNVFVAWSRYSGIPNNAGGLVPNLSASNANVSDKSHVVTIDEAHVFSSRLTNEFTFAIGSGSLLTLSPQEIAFANGSSNPLNSIFQNTGTGANTGILGLNIFNYGQLFNQPTVGYDEYFLASNNSRQLSDNVNWIRGRHSMTFGFTYLRKGEKDFDNVRYVAFGCAPAPGSYCGNGPQIFTANQGVGGDAFADVLLGLPSVIHQRFNYTSGGPFAPEPNVIIPYYGAYFNDKLKVTQRLTISYGLRYELPIPIFATNNICCGIYEPSADTISIPGITPGLPRHYASAPKHDFAPRFSIALQVDPKTVVRAGYGLYYNSGASQISNVLLGALYGGVPGGFVGSEIDNSTPEDASISQIFPASPQVPLGTFPVSTGPGQGHYGPGAFQTVFYADRGDSFRSPYIHRYLLDVERQISRNSAVTLSYLGAEGRNGWYFQDLNAAPYQTGWPSIDAYNAARPFNSGRFGDIYLQRAGLNSNYNAGIVKFQRQMSSGLQILAHYTFSKTLGDRGIIGQGTQDTGYNYPQNIIRSYGEETYSHRHRFLLQTTYEPSYAQHLPSYLRPVLGDWHISAIATFESGDALTVYNGAGNQANDFAAYNGLGNLNMVHNPNLAPSKRTFDEYFDTSAFVVPPDNVQGTASPGIVRGPGQNNWDISLGKQINFYENLHAEFRADMYNAFNHTQWNAVSTQLNGFTGPFGQVTGSREGRIIQLAFKIVF
ncbi:MAG TPA: TonB-dependent receptor [Terriglobales bacterium]|nr:TonB-dependent receptor [Terriglobales bacterium]